MSLSKLMNVSNQSIHRLDEDFILYTNKKIGSGAFGEIYVGCHISSKLKVAVKLEVINNDKTPQLPHEVKVYSNLKNLVGIPKLFAFISKGKYNILVMQLLGKSIEDLFNSCKRIFTMKTVIVLSNHILDRIENIHSRCFIHRDLKPDNIMIGFNSNSKVIYIIDFGLSKRYKDPNTGIHIAYKEGKSLTGTARYTSLNTHLGIEQARRDDIETFIYIIIYLLKGNLPWQGIKAKNSKEKYEKIKNMKLEYKVEDLCKELPIQIKELLQYARNMTFKEKPNYEYIRNKLNEIKNEMNIEYDGIYDWEVDNEKNEEKKDERISRESTKKTTNS